MTIYLIIIRQIPSIHETFYDYDKPNNGFN